MFTESQNGLHSPYEPLLWDMSPNRWPKNRVFDENALFEKWQCSCYSSHLYCPGASYLSNLRIPGSGYLVPGHNGLGFWPDGTGVGTSPPSSSPPRERERASEDVLVAAGLCSLQRRECGFSGAGMPNSSRDVLSSTHLVHAFGHRQTPCCWQICKDYSQVRFGCSKELFIFKGSEKGVGARVKKKSYLKISNINMIRK